jgi:hypothetical protein
MPPASKDVFVSRVCVVARNERSLNIALIVTGAEAGSKAKRRDRRNPS